VRSALAVAIALLSLALPATAGTVTGRVEVLDKGGRARDASEALVYVDGIKGRHRPGKATIVMKGKEFRPHSLAILAGGSVDFPNEDPILHNAFSVSGENRFDLELYKRPKSRSWTFHHPGIVRIYCNIHPQMSAVVLVRDNPFFTKANPDGSFVIEGVPGGRVALKAWHERGGEASLDITVPAEGRVEAQLVLDASSFKRVQHRNKYGKEYSAGEAY
jgi:plastocyanin